MFPGWFATPTDGPTLPFISRVNQIRRENPALQHRLRRGLARHENQGLMAYAKQHAGQRRDLRRQPRRPPRAGGQPSRSRPTWACCRPSPSTTSSRASASTGASARTTRDSTRGRARRTSSRWRPT